MKNKIINLIKVKMKRTVLITGILLMLLLAGNTSLNAQQNMRVLRDSTRMDRPGREMMQRKYAGKNAGT